MARPLYGRTLEIKLVRELMLRLDDGVHSGDQQPVLVVEGGAATGKTTLLDALASGCAGRVPYSYLDLEVVEAELGDAAIPELLAALACQLARRCKLYGSLRFDRLVIGLLALQLELNPVDPQQANAQVIEMLKARRPLTTLKRVLGDMAHEALKFVPAGSFVPSSGSITTLVELSVDGIASRLSTRRRGHGRFQKWYGDQDQELGLDPIDELMGLNWSIRHPTRSDVRSDPHELLCSAFLADLRDNFRTGRHADEWSLNCLLLLDNVDTPLGRAFVHRLVQAWENSGTHRFGSQDPVTVVTTSRGGLLAALSKTKRATVRDVFGAEDVRLTPREHDRGRTVWLRRQLPAFTIDEVHEMVKKLALPEGNSRNLATMLHQLGRGHPGGTEMLLAAVAEERTAFVEPDALLKSRQAEETLEKRLYNRLLVGVPEDAIDDLITCSAGRKRPEGLRLLHRNGMHYQAEPALLPVEMWDPGPDPTLLRLLLLRQLARRPETHQWSWSVAHEMLRETSAQQGNDPVGELYHILANDRVDVVVRALTRQLGKDPLPHWLDLLEAVTAIPHRPSPSCAANNEQDAGWLADSFPHRSGSDDSAEASGLDDGADINPPVFVHTLVSALRAAADPLLGSNRSALYRRIAGGYRDLSRHIDDNSDELFDLIMRYEQLARQWRRDVHRPGGRVQIRA